MDIKKESETTRDTLQQFMRDERNLTRFWSEVEIAPEEEGAPEHVRVWTEAEDLSIARSVLDLIHYKTSGLVHIEVVESSEPPLLFSS